MEEKPLTKSNAVKIGILAGLCTMLLVSLWFLPWAISTYPSPYFRQHIGDALRTIAFTALGLPFGIIGALAGSRMKKTRLVLWIGAVLGIMIGFGGVFLCFMVFYNAFLLQ